MSGRKGKSSDLRARCQSDKMSLSCSYLLRNEERCMKTSVLNDVCNPRDSPKILQWHARLKYGKKL